MPITDLKDSVEAAVLNIAPEKIELLHEVFDKHQPTFEWPDRAAQLPSVEPRTGRINIPPAAAELIWAAAHQYWVIYTEYVEDQKAGKHEFDLTANQRRVSAQLAFTWAQSYFKKPSNPRIAELPAPSYKPVESSDIHVANELFLAAIAWILHHEVAHLRLNHPSISAISREEEKEADLEATHWIFSTECTPEERKKRALGMCVALLVITSIDLESGTFNDASHPKVFDRFDYCLDAVGLEDDHVAYSFAVLMIRLHLAAGKHDLPEPREVEATFKDLFYDHLYAIHQTQQA